MKDKKPYLLDCYEIDEMLRDVNPIGNSTATGAAACWFASRAYEDSVREARRTGLYEQAVKAGEITQEKADRIQKWLI